MSQILKSVLVHTLIFTTARQTSKLHQAIWEIYLKFSTEVIWCNDTLHYICIYVTFSSYTRFMKSVLTDESVVENSFLCMSDPICSIGAQIMTKSLLYLNSIHLTSSVKPSKAYSRGSVVMVDEILNASPSKFRFPEAGLRVMVTSHFGPKTRLRMASRLIITEVQPLILALIRFSCVS